MKSVLGKAIAAVLLSSASVAAFAVNMTPPASGPVPMPQTGNGGLDVQIWTNSSSITAWLGLNFNDFTINSTAANETIDFGTIGGAEFNTLFGGAAAGTVNFNISAANGLTLGANQLITTVASTVTNPLTGLSNASISGSATVLNTAIGANQNALNSSPGSPNFTDLCNSGVNPCVGPTPASNGFGFISTAGDRYGAHLPYSASGTAGGGSLQMFELTQGGSKLSPPPTASAAYAGVWALSSTGDLTYTVSTSAVPLPAAAWLLASGIVGLAGVARRRIVPTAAA